jgi:hypothetical protein
MRGTGATYVNEDILTGHIEKSCIYLRNGQVKK